MIGQFIYIDNYDWEVSIFYDATPEYTPIILRELYRCGAPRKDMREAQRLLNDGHANEGLTFSNPHTSQSVMVIGHTSSVGEFANTLAHETDHLADHISNAYGIPLGSEENAIIHGDILGQILDEAIRDIGGRFKDAWRHFIRHIG